MCGDRLQGAAAALPRHPCILIRLPQPQDKLLDAAHLSVRFLLSICVLRIVLVVQTAQNDKIYYYYSIATKTLPLKYWRFQFHPLITTELSLLSIESAQYSHQQVVSFHKSSQCRQIPERIGSRHAFSESKRLPTVALLGMQC